MPSPKRLTTPPKLRWRLPVPCCRSRSVVLPANVAPNTGVKCHSARTGLGANSSISRHAAAVLRIVRGANLGRQLEEQRREERARHVALCQIEGRAEAVAVRQQDERRLAQRQLEDERGIGIRNVAEMPDDRLALVVL